MVGLVLAFLLIFMPPQFSAQAATASNNSASVTTTTTTRAIEGITGLESNDATVTDMKGNAVNPSDDLYSWLNFNVNYNWSIPDNVQIKDGDTTSFELPNGLVASGDLSFPIYNSSGTAIGTGTIKNGSSTGTITFNNVLENTSLNRKGTLHLIAKGTQTNTNNDGQNWMFNKVGWVGGYDQNGVPNELTWNIAFNPNEHDLSGVTITDTLGANQTYIPGSLTAIGGSYENGGFVSNGVQLHPTVTAKGNTVTITFPDKVSTAVDIYYKVKVTPNPDGTTTWSNNATMASSEGNYNVGSETSWGGSGTGDGNEVGSINLKKTDSITGKALPGAEYKLVDSTGNVLMTNVTTNSDGIINIKNLLLGTYTMTEVKAPAGYHLNPDPITFTIPDNGNLNLNLTQTNEPIGEGNVVLTKSDSKVNKLLPDAIYDLLDGQGNIIQSNLTTDENGQIKVTNLAVGSYSFVETKAPEGYELNSDPIKFEITRDKTTQVEATNDETPKEPDTPITPPDVTPNEPDEPDEPNEPNEPNKPNEPENPGVTNPVEPEIPGVTNPVKPEVPGVTNPSEPEIPGTTNPIEPEVPSTTNPNESESPNNSEVPNVTTPDTGDITTNEVLPPMNSGSGTSGNVGSTTNNEPDTDQKGTFPQTGNEGGLFMLILGLFITLGIVLKYIIKKFSF